MSNTQENLPNGKEDDYYESMLADYEAEIKELEAEIKTLKEEKRKQETDPIIITRRGLEGLIKEGLIHEKDGIEIWKYLENTMSKNRYNSLYEYKGLSTFNFKLKTITDTNTGIKVVIP